MQTEKADVILERSVPDLPVRFPIKNYDLNWLFPDPMHLSFSHRYSPLRSAVCFAGPASVPVSPILGAVGQTKGGNKKRQEITRDLLHHMLVSINKQYLDDDGY